MITKEDIKAAIVAIIAVLILVAFWVMVIAAGVTLAFWYIWA
jgi:hypothetical protein